MALLPTLNEEELVIFRERYRNNDLFRHWSPILNQLERRYGCKDAISLWACSEQCLNRLRQVARYRDTEIDYIMRDLLRETDPTTAVTVMCIVLTRLMNAVEKGHEDEDFANMPMCTAIYVALAKDYKPLAQHLFSEFRGRKTGFDGKPVVIQPSDPMLGNLTLDDMAEEDRGKLETIKKKVIDITRPLQTFWGEDAFGRWEQVWQDICLDTRLFVLLCRKEPRGTQWEMNEKMVCNVIGMFNSQLEKSVEVDKLNKSLQPEKNRRSYISNTDIKAGTDSAFNQQAGLYASVEAIIANHLNRS